MGGMALLVTLAWYSIVGLAWVAVPGESADLAFVAVLGAFSPAGVVGAVAFGWLCWRHVVPERPDPFRGAVAGGLTVLLALGVVAVAAGGVIAVSNVEAVTVGQLLGAVSDFVMVTLLAYVVGGVLAGWLALPLGAFGGWYHERARADADPADPADRPPAAL